MNTVEIIKRKRNGEKLTKDELKFLIDGYLKGKVADYQITSFLMAVYFRGMDDEETLNLTELMLHSGDIINLDHIKGVKVDKHSTGGVGDKTSLILAPQLASLGVYVPMISGRGLGHTGGTLDKLESIPGFRINMSEEEYKSTLGKIGCVMIGQTERLAPADKRFYALRDVTATVDSIPLIASSILSKKLAEGAEALVFDVKMGSGANLQDERESEKLARKLVSVSRKFGKKAVAVLTDMKEPLGFNIGNWLEVEECIEVMNGRKIDDLLKVNNVLAGAMLWLAGKAKDIPEGEVIAEQALDNGTVYAKFLEMVQAHDGSVSYIKDYKNKKRPAYSRKIISDKDGYVNGLDAFGFGVASVMLGAGRKKAEDRVSPLSGIILNKKCGDKILKGESVCELFADDDSKISDALPYTEKAIRIDTKPDFEKKLIIDIID
ncbi:MAG: thymidine phosphorylase [Bacteroidetes bacterium]|nr:thymidine phosphorylase [Bacteroidota bacterium]